MTEEQLVQQLGEWRGYCEVLQEFARLRVSGLTVAQFSALRGWGGVQDNVQACLEWAEEHGLMMTSGGSLVYELTEKGSRVLAELADPAGLDELAAWHRGPVVPGTTATESTMKTTEDYSIEELEKILDDKREARDAEHKKVLEAATAALLRAECKRRGWTVTQSRGA